MFSAGVIRKLQARHFLSGDFGEESVPHSHPYIIEAVCYSESLDGNGFSINIAVLEEVFDEILKQIDDKLLNDLPFFTGKQSSLENLCLYIQENLISGIAGRGEALPEEIEIRIWESDSAWASARNRIE